VLKSSYQFTRIIGIPIRVHISLILLLLLISFAYGVGGILMAIGVFSSVALHELGHSWVAQKKGCRVHQIMLLPIGGIAKMSSIPAQPKDEALIAAAGPLMSLVLALFFSIVANAGFLSPFFKYLAFINTILCLFNLLPSFPMDGGRIFRAFMTPRIGRLRATALAVRIGRILAVAFGIFGLFNGNVFLIFIAFFIYQAAGAEYRAEYAQHKHPQWFNMEQQADVKVSPPPYVQNVTNTWKNLQKKINAFFNDLFKNGQ